MKRFKVRFLLDGGHTVEMYLAYNTEKCTVKTIRDTFKKMIDHSRKGVENPLIIGTKSLKHGDTDEVIVVPSKVCSFEITEIIGNI